MALSEKVIEFAMDDPQRTVALGRTALGYVANAIAPEEPGTEPMKVPVLWVLGAFVVGFGLAAWMSAPGSKEEES